MEHKRTHAAENRLLQSAGIDIKRGLRSSRARYLSAKETMTVTHGGALFSLNFPKLYEGLFGVNGLWHFVCIARWIFSFVHRANKR